MCAIISENFSLLGGDIVSRLLSENIETAFEKCRGKNSSHSTVGRDYSTIFPFTTENISEYIKQFDLNDKSLLTVGSSGDQVINAILYGAKDITEVDINPYAKYFYYLKMASILCLDINDFIDFLSFNNTLDVTNQQNEKNIFSKEKFDKIKSTLKAINGESYDFWNSLFEMFSSIDIRSKMMHLDNRTKIIKKCNPYLQSNFSYEEVKKRMLKVEPIFIESDIRTISFDRKYDNIWLSNIAAFLKKHDWNLVLSKMLNGLTIDGQLLMEYIYIYKPEIITSYPNASNADKRIYPFDGSEDNDKYDFKDAALIYRKNKK